jgi:uncharacterized cofD-like protein
MTPDLVDGEDAPGATAVPAGQVAGGVRALNPTGPSVVAIGGGHGLSRSLGAICSYARCVTAVVSVADDGGSSGRLRESFAIPAPGDIRRCLLALTPRPSKLADALEHRFDSGELEGHAFGNVFLAALTATTGDFVEAVQYLGELLGALGTVLPASASPVELVGLCSGTAVVGQAKIMASGNVSSVSLLPSDVVAPPSVIDAIANAEQIVIGPGSLYTSVLAALAPKGIADAIATSRGRRVYVANLREQIPETKGYDVAAHLQALLSHGVQPDVVLCDTTEIDLGDLPDGITILDTKLTSRQPAMHDESLLGTALSRLV